MKARKRYAIGIVAGLLALTAAAALAGSQEIKRYTLFSGNCDSTEQISAWIPVLGADRVVIRTWTTHAAFAIDGADSLYADSIATWKTLFTDSTVTWALKGLCAVDTTEISGWGIDTTYKQVAVRGVPVNVPLRSPVNGAGMLTTISGINLANAGLAGTTNLPNGVIMTNYMRIKVTPLRRLTGYGSECTDPNPVNGLKGLKMIAYVYYSNK